MSQVVNVKMILVGEGDVGKTSLLVRYADNQFSDSFPDFESKTRIIEMDGVTVKVLLTDTAGQENFRTLTGGMYQGVSGLFVVYDITKPETFEKLDEWTSGSRCYLPARGVHYCILGNKKDLEAERKVSTEDGQKFAQANNAHFFETSALDGTGVDEAFTALLTDIVAEKTGKNTQKKDKASSGCCEVM